jgi:hypothetical protein
MKTRQPFTLLPRKAKSGKAVWYCQVRDEDSGRRVPAKSTGCDTKTDALKEVLRRHAHGRSFSGWLPTLPLANQTRNHVLYSFKRSGPQACN